MPFDHCQIREFRGIIGLTQTQLAEKPGAPVHRSSLGNGSGRAQRLAHRRNVRLRIFLSPIQPLQPGGSAAPSFTDKSLKMADTLILTDDTFQKKCWKPPNLCWLILAPPGAGPATPWSRL